MKCLLPPEIVQRRLEETLQSGWFNIDCLFESQHDSDNTNIPGRDLVSRTRKPRKGLLASEIELYCPEIIYRGPDQTPVLYLEQTGVTIPVLQRATDSPKVQSYYDEKESTKKLLSSDSSSIPVSKYFLGQHVVPNEVCAVCLDIVEVESHLRLLPCGHGFHIPCITRWLVRGSRCPLCNEQVLLYDNCGVARFQHQLDSSLYVGDSSLRQGCFIGSEYYQEAIFESFERIRLRLYRRYLKRLERDEKEERVAEI
ncbi:hypothetical protein GAYE_PCTG52G1241 [Galdieria yellowstonensis]|uniref:RING-type E3 ubiquitin transferase n=1 Tax=Galdieria yellowstonensis TaxID=3028027 RepID=A0AAV9I7Q1_9RHOD|nr:hypothetical protein GAYE_PCTG52G1241 [Galdieria yellowstonensis]